MKTKQRFPKKINIDPVEYTVEIDPTLATVENAFGRITHGDLRIRIASDMDIQREQASLMHEVLHGLFDTMGEREISSDEKLIEALSARMLSLIKGNVELLNYFLEEAANEN